MSQQQQTTTLQEIKNPTPREQNMPAVTMGFGSLQSFELMQRAARLLSSSTLVPAAYRQWDEKKGENPNALANCVVSLNMAQRMGADPLMVMQNLYIVEGRPSWSSQWIIAAINGCGRFSPLRFDLKDLGPKEVEYETTKWVNRDRQVSKHKVTVANLECTAWAIERETGARIDSPRVSIEMAVREGWYGKSGSKWQTMPEVMLRYRTASFFGKLYAPELLMGLQSYEEAADIIDIEMPEAQPRPAADLNQLRTPPQGKAAAPATIIEDKNDDKPNTPESQAGEPGEPEAGTVAGPAGETSQQAAQAQQQNGGADEGPSYAKVRDSLEKAADLEVLDVAADLIGEVFDQGQQEELRTFYRERKDALTNPPAAAGTTTRRAKPQQTYNAE
ncbi:hypothetical protein [Herbaspirillum chlorophenolicum]|uniref:hypothetical protein n=1 Tax=Herbaspirillum chlorophenolicum TaxID=211589 RepID=UPI00067B1C8D|nr:hypothetical protein [Herbaspirillum chlorophenolicum]